MSKYSTLEDGKVLGWYFKRCKVQNFRYIFYIGDIMVGQIFHVNDSWTATSPYPGPLNHCKGLKTRHDAAEFLLKVRRVWRGEEK